MNAKKLIEFFELRQQQQQPMVLATVYETEGSTYSKAGARMLVDADGKFQGMLSGGCLEGDLALRAKAVVETGMPQMVTYDLGSDNDELWGLGVGCDGLMRVFLQALRPSENYEPFSTIARLLSGNERAVAVTAIESKSADVPAGATLVLTENGSHCFGLVEDFADGMQASANEILRSTESRTMHVQSTEGELLVLYGAIIPMPNLLILGAGLDAEPVLRFASELGWRCTVVDHRPAYLASGDFSLAESAVCCATDELETSVPLNNFELAIVMSHHLASDRLYLKTLASSAIHYIGLLGPPGRRDRLLSELGPAKAQLADRLHGPAGLDLGGRGPGAIALSIVAEMQKALSCR